MDQINSIRDLSQNGLSAAKIAETLSVDEKTVRKYLSETDFSPRPPEKRVFPSKLDPYKEQIERWLEEDKKTWYKQRHTARRIHDRLGELHSEYDCGYLLVQRYVKKRRAEEAARTATQELVWHPGEAQADFGEADFYEAGELVRKKYLTLSFPFSNGGWSRIFGGACKILCVNGLTMVKERSWPYQRNYSSNF